MRTIEGNRISEYLFFNKFYFIALMLLKAVIAIMFVGLAIIGQIVIDMVNIPVSYTHLNRTKRYVPDAATAVYIILI